MLIEETIYSVQVLFIEQSYLVLLVNNQKEDVAPHKVTEVWVNNKWCRYTANIRTYIVQPCFGYVGRESKQQYILCVNALVSRHEDNLQLIACRRVVSNCLSNSGV